MFLEPIPKKGDLCWFYDNDCIDIKHEYKAIVEEIIFFWLHIKLKSRITSVFMGLGVKETILYNNIPIGI